MKAFKKIQAAVSPVLLTLTIFIIPFVVVYSGLGETNDKRWGDTDNSLNSSIQRSTPQLQSLLHHKVAQKTKVISKPSIPLVQNHIHYHYGVNSPRNNGRNDIKTIFIGVFTTAYKYERRALLRSLYAPLLKRAPEIDLKFIVARDQYDDINERVRIEEREYGDIFQLHIEEVAVY